MSKVLTKAQMNKDNKKFLEEQEKHLVSILTQIASSLAIEPKTCWFVYDDNAMKFYSQVYSL